LVGKPEAERVFRRMRGRGEGDTEIIVKKIIRNKQNVKVWNGLI